MKVTVPLVLHIGKNKSNKLNSVWSSFNECFMLSLAAFMRNLFFMLLSWPVLSAKEILNLNDIIIGQTDLC